MESRWNRFVESVLVLAERSFGRVMDGTYGRRGWVSRALDAMSAKVMGWFYRLCFDSSLGFRE